jgi:hypothetical protein
MSDRPSFKPALPPERLPQEPRGSELVFLASGVHPTILYPSPPPTSAQRDAEGSAPGSTRPANGWVSFRHTSFRGRRLRGQRTRFSPRWRGWISLPCQPEASRSSIVRRRFRRTELEFPWKSGEPLALGYAAASKSHGLL